MNSGQLSKLFIEFSKNTTRLVRPYKEFVIFCTGGMAARLWLQDRQEKLPEKVRRTIDFDFTFAKKTPDALEAMQRVMVAHMYRFTQFLNRKYIGINARIRLVHIKVPSKSVQVPGTGRRVEHIITFQIVTGKNDVTELVDAALSVYPGASRNMIDMPLSCKLGIPIQKLRYQVRDFMALLSGSFLYKGIISKRNPLTGEKMEKGIKNIARLSELVKHSKIQGARSVLKPFFKKIKSKHVLESRKKAVHVEKFLKKIV